MFLEQKLRKASLLSVGLLAVVLLTSGCGSSSGEADPLTKAQFVQQADSICRAAEQERGDALKEAAAQGADNGNAKTESVYFVTEAALPPIQEMTEELGDLAPPRDDRSEVQAIVAAFEKAIARLEADPTDLTAAVSAFAKPNRLAEEYGLADCTI